MNQHDQMNDDDYNVVIDTLQNKLDTLEKMQRGCDNINSSIGGGIGFMDCIRYEQMDELRKAIKREQALAAEPAPLVRLTDEDLLNILHKTKDTLLPFEHGALLFGRAIMDAMQERNK